MHNKLAVGWVHFDGTTVPAKSWVNLTPDDLLYSQEGKRLDAKGVRKWIWDRWRGKRMTRRRELVLWSVYDQATERSYVGMGAEVDEQVSERLNQMRWSQEFPRG